MKKICTALFILLSVSLNPVNSAPLPRMLDQFPGQKTFFTPLDIDADSSHSYDALHLAVELVPDLEGMSFTAEVTMTARIMEDDLETLPMDHLMLTIDSVWVDGENADFSANASSLTITLPEAAAEGDTLSVRVAYHGRIRADNSFGGMMYNEGSDVLFTFGEPYRTRAWIVCYDKPFDKVTSEIAVTMDNSYHVVSNGSLSEVEDVGDDLSRTVWSNDYPISTYLISVCAHPYLVIDLGGAGRNDTPVNLWVYPQDSAAAMSSMGRTPDMIEYFEDRFGPFPFDKYDAAEASIAANMEHQTATTMTEGVIRSGPVNEWVVAHELAHQWWGDMVGPLTFKEIWLNEGLASYSHMLWFGHEDEELFRRGMDQIALAYFQEDRSRRYPIWDPPVRYLFGTAVYYKGAWVMHMLRGLIGDEDFFTGWRSYGEAHAYGSAVTPELQEAMEDASGMDLSDFFQQWVYSAGYPEYSATNFTVSGDGDDGYSAQLDLAQVQEHAPIFTIPVPIRFYGDDGDTTVRFEIAAEPSQTLVVDNLSFEPVGFEFDPGGWILCVFDDNTTVKEDRRAAPGDFTMLSVYPNPFNSTAVIRYALPHPGQVSLHVCDPTGRRMGALFEGYMYSGIHTARLNDARMPSGLYFIRLETPGEVLFRQAVLIK